MYSFITFHPEFKSVNCSRRDDALSQVFVAFLLAFYSILFRGDPIGRVQPSSCQDLYEKWTNPRKNMIRIWFKFDLFGFLCCLADVLKCGGGVARILIP